MRRSIHNNNIVISYKNGSLRLKHTAIIIIMRRRKSVEKRNEYYIIMGGDDDENQTVIIIICLSICCLPREGAKNTTGECCPSQNCQQIIMFF